MLAAQLSGATLNIEGTGFTLSGTLNNAVAIPEPATGSLLAIGLASLAVWRSAYFRGRLP